MTTDTTRAPGAQPADAPAIPKGDWDAAWRHYQDVKATYEAYQRETYDLAFEREQAFLQAHGVPTTGAGAYQRRTELQASHGTEWQVPTDVSAEVDRLCNITSDAEGVLLAIPAPDIAALRWKLDRLLASEPDGSVPGWSAGSASQTVADYRRLLAHQLQQPTADDWLANLASFRKVEAEQRHFFAHGDGSDQTGAPLFERFARALDKVLLTPAPDFPALAQKLAIYDANEIDDGWNLARDMTTLLARDAARLTWQAALVPFEQATAALEHCHEDEEVDAGADAQLAAMVALLLAPAPDAEALSRKLAIIRSEQAWGLKQGGDMIMDSLAEDVRRLTKEA